MQTAEPLCAITGLNLRRYGVNVELSLLLSFSRFLIYKRMGMTIIVLNSWGSEDSLRESS